MADHPVKVPEELVKEWAQEIYGTPGADTGDVVMADRAAQWGADQELEACCDAIYLHEGRPLCGGTAEWLRATRRPKPPSLAERALKAVISGVDPDGKNGQVILEALTRLAELEAQQ